MHLAWDYLHMVADNGNVALLELRERIYNTGSAEIPADAAPPVLPYQQETVVAQAPPAGRTALFLLCYTCQTSAGTLILPILHQAVPQSGVAEQQDAVMLQGTA